MLNAGCFGVQSVADLRNLRYGILPYSTIIISGWQSTKESKNRVKTGFEMVFLRLKALERHLKAVLFFSAALENNFIAVKCAVCKSCEAVGHDMSGELTRPMNSMQLSVPVYDVQFRISRR